MSEDYADRTLRTVINLGRYGELFAYDENAQTFSYENPDRQGLPKLPLWFELFASSLIPSFLAVC